MSKLINLYHLKLNNVNRIFFLLLLFNLSNTSILSQTNSTNIKTIVIDPGHGGKDSGTLGTKRFKIYEKHVALAVSLKLGNYISEAFPDVKIIYTRDTDVFLELNERTEIANKSNADLFTKKILSSEETPNTPDFTPVIIDSVNLLLSSIC